MENKLIPLGLVFVLLLAIGLGSLALLFQPAQIHYEPIDQFGVLQKSFDGSFGSKDIEELPAYSPSALTSLGLALRGRAWIVYPQYNIGLAIIMAGAFLGAIYLGSFMVALNMKVRNKIQDYDAL